MNNRTKTKTINQISKNNEMQLEFDFMKEDKPTKKKSADGLVSKGGSITVRNPYAYPPIDQKQKGNKTTKNVRERIVTGDMVDGNQVVAAEYVTYGVSSA